jgi:hypothetical protein
MLLLLLLELLMSFYGDFLPVVLLGVYLLLGRVEGCLLAFDLSMVLLLVYAIGLSFRGSSPLGDEASCSGRLDGMILICYFSATEPPQPILKSYKFILNVNFEQNINIPN